MTIIICGSRTFDDPEFLFRKLDSLTRKLDKKKLTICTGAQRSKAKDGHWHGADFFAEQWAAKNWCNLLRFHEDTVEDKCREMWTNQVGAVIVFNVEGETCDPLAKAVIQKARVVQIPIKEYARGKGAVEKRTRI